MGARKACFCCGRYLRKLAGLKGGRACPVCDPRCGSGCPVCKNQWRKLWKDQAAHDQAVTRRAATAKPPPKVLRQALLEFDLAMIRDGED